MTVLVWRCKDDNRRTLWERRLMAYAIFRLLMSHWDDLMFVLEGVLIWHNLSLNPA